jgi:hypothetical protein
MSKLVRAGALLAFVTVGACSPQLPGLLVGESTHFRLYVSPGAYVPAGWDGEAGLVALETNWTDTATLLPLSAGKIEYHWVAVDELTASCTEYVAGCEFEGPIVVAYDLPDQHELDHAYMELMTKTHDNPIPLVTEGYAEAIGCGQGSGALLIDPTRWQDLVALPEATADFQAEGGVQGALLVRYLIRNWGADRFVAYYAQATKLRDPALFADDFQRFWGMSLDAAWAAMKTVAPGENIYDGSLCPCWRCRSIRRCPTIPPPRLTGRFPRARVRRSRSRVLPATRFRTSIASGRASTVMPAAGPASSASARAFVAMSSGR